MKLVRLWDEILLLYNGSLLYFMVTGELFHLTDGGSVGKLTLLYKCVLPSLVWLHNLCRGPPLALLKQTYSCCAFVFGSHSLGC